MASTTTLPPTYVEGFHNLESVRRTEYRPLGQTGMLVSKLSLGGGAFGSLYRDCEEETAIEIIVEAVKNGINYIDSSYWYGQGRSEILLGKAFQRIPRNAYYIGTKIGRYELDYERMFDFSAETSERCIDEALQRLQLPYVDIMQVHDLEFSQSEDVILQQTLPVLQKAKEAGKARFIGITGYPLRCLQSIIDKSSIQLDTILSYCRATLHDQELSNFVPKFQVRGIGVINAAPTSMGLLTRQGPPNWHPATEKIKDSCKQAVNYCQERGIDIAKLALYHSANFPGVDTCLVGIDRIEYVKSNLDTVWTPLSDEERICLDAIKTKYFEPLGNANWEAEAEEKFRIKINNKSFSWMNK